MQCVHRPKPKLQAGYPHRLRQPSISLALCELSIKSLIDTIFADLALPCSEWSIIKSRLLCCSAKSLASPFVSILGTRGSVPFQSLPVWYPPLHLIVVMLWVRPCNCWFASRYTSHVSTRVFNCSTTLPGSLFGAGESLSLPLDPVSSFMHQDN